MPGRLILLIDDDPLSNVFNTMMIKKNHPGTEVYAITNAKDALKYLLDDKRKRPELIFLDLNMPVMNGWDFLEEYKKLNLGIKVVLVTSSNDSDDISKSKGYKEVKHYLVKPITFSNLKEAVALIGIS